MKTERIKECVLFNPLDTIKKFRNYHVRQDPIYIVDLINPADMYITIADCYAIDKSTLAQYHHSNHEISDARKLMKAHKTYIEQSDPFNRPQTKLAKIADRLFKRSSSTSSALRTKIYRPLFSSIISPGVDTFSGRQERVIEERTRTKEVLVNSKHSKLKHKLQIGNLTGVSIGVHNLLPIRSYIPLKSTVNAIKMQNNALIRMYRGW